MKNTRRGHQTVKKKNRQLCCMHAFYMDSGWVLIQYNTMQCEKLCVLAENIMHILITVVRYIPFSDSSVDLFIGPSFWVVRSSYMFIHPAYHFSFDETSPGDSEPSLPLKLGLLLAQLHYWLNIYVDVPWRLKVSLLISAFAYTIVNVIKIM